MKHAALIPLAGGAVIGASQALGRPPQWMASWPAFAKNDSFIRQYYPNVPFYTMSRLTGTMDRVQLITCVPPCSGLSTATPSASRGCQAPQNEHMLQVARYGMEMLTPAILIENAPTLYGKGGEAFANRFRNLCARFEYTMMLVKTSTILHGLPQNRVRSFIILYRGNYLPEFAWIDKPYKPLYLWPVDKNPTLSTEWKLKDDELMRRILFHHSWADLKKNYLNDGPRSAWSVYNQMLSESLYSGKSFSQKPYKYMWDTQQTGAGIMDRSPILVNAYSNALMWKSAHKMLNPATHYKRQFSIRELMNLMGMPKDYKEIPAKDINVLFQNVPVTTVKTMVQEIEAALGGSRKWYKPDSWITRINNIKQTIDVWK